MKAEIVLEGLSFYAFHGFYEEEQRSGNNFLVDVRISCELDDNCDFDNLHNSINYEEVYSIVKSKMIIPSKLLENVAKNILDSVIAKWLQIESVEVSIAKLSAPVGGPCRNARVTLKKSIK